MGARPARDIVSSQYDATAGTVLTTFREAYGTLREGVTLADTPRPELSRLAAEFGVKYSNGDSSDQIRNAIAKRAQETGLNVSIVHVAPNGYDPATGEPRPDPVDPAKAAGIDPSTFPDPVLNAPWATTYGPDPDPVTRPVPTVPVTAADPTADAKAQAVADLLAILGKSNNVDPAAVSAIVDARLADHVAKTDAVILARLADLNAPVVNHIHVPGTADPIVLNGRQHHALPDVLLNAACRIHTYLVGPPGTGKSTLAQNAAESLGLAFSYIACFPTMPASNLWGFIDAGGTYHATEFRRRYETGGVFLFDEIDNGHAGTTASINAAIANGHAAFPDGMVKRHPDFIVVAAANTWGNGATSGAIGRNALDAATLDRFDKVEINIDDDLELDLAFAHNPNAKAWVLKVRRMRENALKHGIKVVISPRASIDGAKLLAAGRSEKRTAEGRILSGLTPEQRSRILEGVSLS